MLLRLSLLVIVFGALSAHAGPKTFPVSASTLKGAPTVEPDKTTGYYLWIDKAGLHLRWTTDGLPVLFSGRLDLDKPVKDLKRILDVGPGWARAHGDRVILFSSTSRGAVDGMDLVIPGGSRARIELQINGEEALPELVFLGDKGTNPQGLPLNARLR